MCGIVGYISASAEEPHSSALCAMLDAIRHRGPDAQDIRYEGQAALGHARLSIIDLKGGAQPMTNEDGSLWIVFNGEIYNYVELRDELLTRGHRFATRSDTEVILHLFEDFGGDCVSRLNGQWAMAIWDTRRRRLFLSRDRLGVRPLFYTLRGRSLIFASEVKALFRYPAVSPELDLDALDEILTFWYTLSPRTAFAGVHELPPGASAWYSDGSIEIAPYWQPDFEPLKENRSEDDYAEELLALLTDATRLRLRSDVPVGAYLSGGLDSTLIAALVKRLGISNLSTFSVRFDGAEVDEGPFQELAARCLETNHREIRCSSAEIARAFPDVIWHIEKPIVRTAPAPMFLLSNLVRNSGYKVVLTGEGADELLGGYDIFRETKVRAFCAAQPSSRLRPLLLRRLYPYMSQIQSLPTAYLKEFFKLEPGDLESPLFSHLPRWRLTARLKLFYSDDVRRRLARHDPLASLAGSLPLRFGGWNAFTRAQYLETRHLLPGYILSSQGDRVAMAHAVEGRFPFLDHRVAEFASRLPARLKLSGLREKRLLKRVAREFVPAEVLRRPKQPYRAPDAECFFSGPGAEYIEDILSPAAIRRFGVFDAASVGKLVAKARNGRATGVADNMAVVAIVSTHILMDRFHLALN